MHDAGMALQPTQTRPTGSSRQRRAYDHQGGPLLAAAHPGVCAVACLQERRHAYPAVLPAVCAWQPLRRVRQQGPSCMRPHASASDSVGKSGPPWAPSQQDDDGVQQDQPQQKPRPKPGRKAARGASPAPGSSVAAGSGGRPAPASLDSSMSGRNSSGASKQRGVKQQQPAATSLRGPSMKEHSSGPSSSSTSTTAATSSEPSSNGGGASKNEQQLDQLLAGLQQLRQQQAAGIAPLNEEDEYEEELEGEEGVDWVWWKAADVAAQRHAGGSTQGQPPSDPAKL